jgi:hypothetical protein
MRINTSRGSKERPNNTDFNLKQAATNIDYKDLNSFIWDQGVRIKVYKTLFCARVKSIDGSEHEINCPICNGSGFIDVSPTETVAAIQNQIRSNNINPDQIGTAWEEQTAFMTFLSGIELSYYTRIELMDYTNVYKQLVQRQVDTNIDRLQFKATSVDYLIDYDGIIYIPGNDFIVDRNGDIEWLIGTGTKKPADKKIYSIHYNTLVAYRAIEAVHCDRFGSDGIKKDHLEVIEYPQMWKIKKLYLFHHEDSESGAKLNPNKLWSPGE